MRRALAAILALLFSAPAGAGADWPDGGQMGLVAYANVAASTLAVNNCPQMFNTSGTWNQACSAVPSPTSNFLSFINRFGKSTYGRMECSLGAITGTWNNNVDLVELEVVASDWVTLEASSATLTLTDTTSAATRTVGASLNFTPSYTGEHAVSIRIKTYTDADVSVTNARLQCALYGAYVQ